MPSTYSASLRLTLPATGENTGTWGSLVNTGITELTDAAIAGTATISTWGGAGVSYTLSSGNGVADEARKMFLVATGSPGENKNIICPAVSKLYFIYNSVSGGYTVTLKTPSGTGVTVPNGRSMMLYCDGTNVVTLVSNFSTMAIAGNPLTIGGAVSTGGALTTGGAFTTSGAYALTFTLTNTTSLTLPTTGTVVARDSTDTLTNKNIQSRVVAIADGTSITINADTTDIATQANTQAAGTLTVNAPTGTPFNGQKLVLRLQSTNVQTFSWNSVFTNPANATLPTTSSGSSKYDYIGFIYNSTAGKWQMVAKMMGF